MSILFRCPCGRSMVAASDRAGAIVTCPNCKRALKVPTGKDRGVELAPIPAAAKTRSSRRCLRCGKDVPVDSQICPHCRTILMDGGAPAAPAAAAPKASASATALSGAAAAARSGTTILYGGSRATWWSRLSTGGKAGVLSGIGVFAILAVVIAAIIGSSWQAGELQGAREQGERNLVEGRKLEINGQFQEAYDKYSFTWIKDCLRASTLKKDRELADAIEARFIAFVYLAEVPQVRIGESIYWKPTNQQEFEQANAQLRDTYPTYRQRVLSLVDVSLAAVQAAQSNANKTAYEEKVGQIMDLYVALVAQTTPQQRAQTTFQQLLAALRALADANRHWDVKLRGQDLLNAKGYFEGLKEFISRPGYPDNIWQR